MAYTEDQLMQALRNADAAGDTEAARAIARRIQSVRQSAAPKPEAAPQPEPRGMGAEVGRQLGLTGRYALEGAGQALGIFADPIAEALNAVSPGRPFGRLGDAAAAGADALGLPKPEGGLERVVGDASRAVAGAGGTTALARGTATTLSGPLAGAIEALAANPGTQLASAATGAGASGAAREEGASPAAQAGIGILAAMAPSATTGTVRTLARGGEEGRQAMLDTMRAFEDAGSSPTVGQATGKRWIQGSEQLLGRVPGASGVIARTGERQAADVGRRVEEIAASLAPKSSPEQAGRAIERGITGPGGFMANFRAKSAELYDEVGRLLPPDTKVPAASTVTTLADLSTPIQGAQNTSAALLNSRVATIAKAFQDDLQANGGFMSYDTMKKLRTQVGELIGDSALSPDTPTRQLRALYGAISQDMTEAAKATNNPQVVRAVSRANSYYRAASNRLDDIERVIDRNGGPEAVFRAATAGTREGATTLRSVMQSLPPDAQRQVSATVLRRLGRANPSAQDDLGEAFSTETFLTNWNRLSPEAKRTLFDRYGQQYVRDMDAVAKTASRIRESGQVFANPSRTSDAAIQGGTIGGLVLSTVLGDFSTGGGIALTMGAANGASRVLTSPKVVSWLAQNGTRPVTALVPQLAALKAQAEKDGDEAALEFVQLAEQRVGEAGQGARR